MQPDDLGLLPTEGRAKVRPLPVQQPAHDSRGFGQVVPLTDAGRLEAEPVRCYKVLGLYDDLASEGTVIREEADGFKVLLDLQKHDKAEAVAALEAILARLKG